MLDGVHQRRHGQTLNAQTNFTLHHAMHVTQLIGGLGHGGLRFLSASSSLLICEVSHDKMMYKMKWVTLDMKYVLVVIVDTIYFTLDKSLKNRLCSPHRMLCDQR